MSMKETVLELKKLAAENKIAEELFIVWAHRKRARNEITMKALCKSMEDRGFTYPNSEYNKILEVLASLGLGVIKKDFKGRVKGLYDVPVSFSSIGEVAVNSSDKLNPFKSRRKYKKLFDKGWTLEEQAPKPVEVVPPQRGQIYELNLEILINGKSLHIPVPKDLSKDELATLISKWA